MVKKIILLLFLINVSLISFIHAQAPRTQQLKKLIRNIDVIPSGEPEIIKIQSMINECEECTGVGYLKIAGIYFKNNKISKALDYLEKINNQKLITSDGDLEDFFSLKVMWSNVYRTSGKNVKALEQLQEFPADAAKDYPYFSYYIFLLKGGIYTSLQNNAESLKYFRSAYKLSKICRTEQNLKKLSSKKELQITNSYKSTPFLAATYLEAGKVDSAKIYIKEALGDLKKLDPIKNADIMYSTYLIAGSIYVAEKDYKTAATNYLLSKKIIERYWPRTDAKNAVYKSLLELYEKEGLHDSIDYYSRKILDLENKNKKENIIVNKSIDLTEANQMKNLESSNKKLTYTLIIIITLLTLLIYYTLFFYKKYKERSLDKKDIPLDDTINQQYYNQSFQEIILLAKGNKPEFLTRFNNLFPDFSTKLLSKNEMMQSSEIRFCAYLYLNFSTKDIAECTYTSIRTVQTKKYNLRKKLNIPTDVDIYVWFDHLLK